MRDLRDGEWRALFRSDERSWHPRGRELVKKLATQGRLIRFESALPDPPPDDRHWCAEALATRAARPFRGRRDRDAGHQGRIRRQFIGCPNRPARLRGMVGWAESLGEARARPGGLQDTTRSDPALLELDHLHRSAPGSGETGIPQLRIAACPGRFAETTTNDRDPPCLLRGIRSRAEVPDARRRRILRASVP